MADESGNPSFLKSTWEGIKGYVKGALAGGAFGAAVGAVIGVAIAYFSPDTVMQVASQKGMEMIADPAMRGLGHLVYMATAGATSLGMTFGIIGATAGTITGGVKSRESGKVPIEDAVKAVQVSMAQGMAVEQLRRQAMDSKWQDRIAAERKTPGIDTGQRLHS